MIIAFLGGIGSGKSASMAKRIVNSPYYCYSNMHVNAVNHERIKISDIVKTEKEENGKKIKEIKKVNWEFWENNLEQKGEYHIFLDEVHNILSPRQSMSKWNVLAGQWLTQIRKLLGDSEETNLYIGSQTINSIEKILKGIIHMIIYCEKREDRSQKIYTYCMNRYNKVEVKLCYPTYIIEHLFIDKRTGSAIDKFYRFLDGAKSYNFRLQSFVNPYFKYYNTKQLFKETAYI